MNTFTPLYVDMKEYLELHPEKLEELVLLYLDTWSFDQNFQEYFICIECKKYFGYNQVVGNKRLTCSQGHFLERAWTIPSVRDYILSQLEYDGFYGTLAIDPRVGETGSIIGFSWSRLEDFEEQLQKMGTDNAETISHLNPSEKIPYFAEIGLAPQYRGNKIGAMLTEKVCLHLHDMYPTLPSLLRTHQDSPAAFLYDRVGYNAFGYDSVYGYGRIIMVIDQCSDFIFNVL